MEAAERSGSTSPVIISCHGQQVVFVREKDGMAMALFFFFLNSSSIPVGIRMDRPAGLSTTQVLNGSLLLESGKNEKEK